jgi:hypothetical protein
MKKPEVGDEVFWDGRFFVLTSVYNGGDYAQAVELAPPKGKDKIYEFHMNFQWSGKWWWYEALQGGR